MRHQAIVQTLFEPCSLNDALAGLGFVQADPIRAPARAQDLILRHRVGDYHAGDLERRYPELDLDEAYLYVYGFLPRPTAKLLFPSKGKRLTKLQTAILDLLKEEPALIPNDIERHFGKRTAANGWGGQSGLARLAMEDLHRRGHLRVVGRQRGIRIYGAARISDDVPRPSERFRRLVLLAANLLAPLSQQSLQEVAARIERPPRTASASVVKQLLADGELVSEICDGVAYVWPFSAPAVEAPPERVRFLSPFDPLVWDRRRFEHFWGWPYRFEAYTPAAKRRWGYYALPMLFRDQMIGWANLAVASGHLAVDLGYVNQAPTEPGFKTALGDEIERFEAFLGLSESAL